jgi:hypothetical protein
MELFFPKWIDFPMKQRCVMEVLKKKTSRPPHKTKGVMEFLVQFCKWEKKWKLHSIARVFKNGFEQLWERNLDFFFSFYSIRRAWRDGKGYSLSLGSLEAS